MGERDPDPTSTVAIAGQATPAPTTREAGPGPGDRIGRFVVERRLGEGGMGVVFLARDPELGRPVAIKVVRPARATEHARARMLREAQALARVAHPNVVVIYDVGRVRESVFLAMEYVEGETLAEWVAGARRDWREVLSAFAAAGRGLAAAHDAGLTHRDFKPSNVLVGRDGRVRVVDFGLARAGDDADTPPADGGAAASPALTESGVLVGTPAYMAPEQWRRVGATARSDQFSFCLCLWQALHGQAPFALAGGAEPTWTLRLAPAGDVPARIDSVLERGLAVDPERRWPSMAALLDALADPVARRRRVAVGLALGAALATAGVVAVARRPAPPDPCAGAAQAVDEVWNDARRAAVTRAVLDSGAPAAAATAPSVLAAIDRRAAAWRSERSDACAATWVRHQQSDTLLDRRMACGDVVLARLDALVGVWAGADRATVDHAGALLGQIDGLPACGADVATPPADPGRRAFARGEEAVLTTTAALHFAKKLPAARALAQHVLVEARALGLKPLAARALKELADVTPPRDAEARFKEAIAAAEEAGDDVDKAKAWRGLAFVHAIFQRRFDEAHQDVAYARSASARAGGADPHDAALTDVIDAIILAEEGRGAEAAPIAERAIAALERADGEGALLAGNLINTANVEVRAGRYGEARGYYERARAINVRLFGEDYASAPVLAQNLGDVAVFQKDYAGALPLLERAVAGQRRKGPDATADVGRVLVDLASCLRHLGRTDEARAQAHEAAEILAAATGAHSGSFADALALEGSILLEQGHATAAIDLLQRGFAIRDGNHDGPENIAEVELDLARALWAARHDPRARPLAEAARTQFVAAKSDAGVKGADAVLATLRGR